jgi:hypothetical protein
MAVRVHRNGHQNREDKNMTSQKTAVVGIYPDHSSLAMGVRTLKDAGFRSADISLLYSQGAAGETSGRENEQSAAEGAATGASTGVVVGGVLGWLAGIGSLVIPGAGTFIAAGPILAALAGAGAGGAVGGLAGGLAGLGVSDHQARHYQAQLTEGRTLLSAHADNPYWEKRAREILESTGAKDITVTTEQAAVAEGANPLSLTR